MKQVTSFCCDVCGFGYETEEECLKCEASHAKPVKLELCGYRRVAESRIPYPEIMIFDMEDGKHTQYVFDKVLPEETKETEEEVPAE